MEVCTLLCMVANCSDALLHSKSYYLKQVHQPRHLPHPARFFGPDVLEVLPLSLITLTTR